MKLICFDKKIISFLVLFFSIFSGVHLVYAVGEVGTIDGSFKLTKICKDVNCTSFGNINWKPTINSNTPGASIVVISDTSITGYLWGDEIGWVNMSPTGAGVYVNPTTGTLSGKAFASDGSWINFNPTGAGVTLVNNGAGSNFSGYAWVSGPNGGWMKFDCSSDNTCVKTSWMISSARPNGNTGDNTGGHISVTTTPPPDTTTPPNPDEIPDIPENPEVPDIPETPEVPIVTETPPTVTTPDIQISPVDTSPNTPVVTETPIVTTPPVSVTTPNNNQNVNTAPNNEKLSDYIQKNVNKGIKNATKAVSKAREKVSVVLETPAGNVTSKTIETTGAVTGVSLGTVTSLFANPISFSELWFIPLRLWSLLLVALGIKKRNVPWGTVYDSVTKQPLDPAYVVLEDLDGNEIATSITDLDGRYGFLVPAGKYRIVANKTHYQFPSQKLYGKSNDELYQELYFNEIIDVPEGGVISKNIPMDPLKFDWNEFAKKDKKLMKFFSARDIWISRIINFLFYFGFAFSILSLLVSTTFINIIIFSVYVVFLVLKRTVLKPRAFGFIQEKENGDPLSFAIMKIFFTGKPTEVAHKVADSKGKYYCLIPNGKYFVKIENKKPDGTYSLAYVSEPIDVSKGYIDEKFKV